MRAHLSYLRHRFTSPAWLDFVDMGLGIEHRERRFRASWGGHLRRSRAFVEEALAGGGDEVTILGVGRLFDVPVERLVDRFSRVVLVDVDPRVVAHCRRAVRRWAGIVEVYQADVTEVFNEWTKTLELVRRADAAEVIATLAALKTKQLCWGNGTVVSINLLSQLGVMWRDRVQRIVGAVQMMCPKFGEATAQSIMRLEEAHVLGLAAADRAVLVADRYFITAQEAGSRWEVEDALYGTWPEQVPDKTCWLSGSWLWHVVPINGEIRGQGIVHEVWARAFW